jgi:lysophospholipase L1-like esterase
MNAVAMVYGATSTKLRANGIEHVGAANGTTITVDEFAHIWGYAGAGSFQWGQEMVALYFYDRDLTSAELLTIEEWHSVETPTTALIIVGDSFVGGTGATTAQEAYARILEAETGKSLVAIGGAGLRLSALNLTDLTDAVTASVSAGLNPIVVLDIGKNDLAANTSAATLETLYESYCDAITGTGAKLVCVTMPPRADGFSGGSDSTSYETQRLLFNAWLLSQTSMFDEVADTAANANLGQTADLSGPYYDGDNIHLSDLGHAEWASVILPKILAV